MEGSSQTVSSRIKLQQERMEVSKKGAVNSQMIFEPDRKSESWYGTPYGNMLAGIQVKNMKIEETRDVIRASVEYSLELNYEHMADCRPPGEDHGQGKRELPPYRLIRTNKKDCAQQSFLPGLISR